MTLRQIGGSEMDGILAIQSGASNLLDLTQNGGDNQAEIRQNGNANAALITQNGGNQLMLMQTGDNLAIAIDQPAGQALTVTQGR